MVKKSIVVFAMVFALQPNAIAFAAESGGMGTTPATPAPTKSATPVVTPVVTPAAQASITPAPSKESLLAASMAKARELIAGKDWQGAIKELLIAQKLELKRADALNLLGFSHRKIGEFSTSLTYYKAALRLDPRHKGARKYLGELYLVMKNPKKAAAELAALKRICGITCEEYLDLAGAIKKAKK